MSFGYHAQALTRDVSVPFSCVIGRGNVAAVSAELEQRGAAVPPDVLEAVEKLRTYFHEMCRGLGKEAFQLAFRQEFRGELLSEAEGKVLEAAGRRRINTSIGKMEAMRLARLIGDYAANSDHRRLMS